MKLKVKKLDTRAIIPQYASSGAACFDLHALLSHDVIVDNDNPCTINTGLVFEIPDGYVMLIYSRSGHAFKNDVRLANCTGVIDSDYRGEVKIKLTCDSDVGLRINPGDRIAQAMLIPIPTIVFEEVDTVKSTERGSNGFGSTGQ